MPNGESTRLPPFPTVWTEADIERLDFLKEQRKALERAYRVKFSAEAWAEAPAWERGIRRAVPSWLAPVAEVATIGVEETTEFGFTPEQFQERATELEEEFQELVRRQKVTSLLPDIQADIMIAALSGDAIRDTSELMSTFPELGADFTEEEIGYLSRMAQALAGASPEQILSGELFAYEPSQLPITEEDLDVLFREGIQDPRHIFATVEFARSLEDVTQALRQAYPAQPEEPEEAVREKLKEYYQQRAIQLGIIPEGEKPTKEAIRELHEKVAEEAGESLVLINEETGDVTAAIRKTDGSVWSGTDLVGYYEEEQLYPVDLLGHPLKTEEEQLGLIGRWWNYFWLGARQAHYGGKEAVFGAIPAFIQALGEPISAAMPMPSDEDWNILYGIITNTIDWTPDVTKRIEAMEARGIKTSEVLSLLHDSGALTIPRDRAISIAKGNLDIWSARVAEAHQVLEAKFELRQTQFMDYLREHPELLPPAEFFEGAGEHPELYKNPDWYAYVILSNAPVLATALAAGVTVGVATQNPLAGAFAGAAVITPVETGNLHADLVSAGVSPTQAAEMSVPLGSAIGAVEIIPGLILLKAVAPAFVGIFRKHFRRELTKQVTKGLIAKNILKTATKVEIAEVTEEVIQEAMHNAAMVSIGEYDSITDGLDQVAIETAIAVLPLAGMGSVAEYVSMRNNLPQRVRAELDATVEKMEEAGLETDHAQAVAATELMETETGQEQVKRAIETAEEQAVVPAKIIKAEERLDAYNSEILVTQFSIKIHQDRLDKGGLDPDAELGEIAALERLQSNLEELQTNVKLVTRKIKKARRELEKASPVVEEPKELVATPPEEPVSSETAIQFSVSPYFQQDPLLPTMRPRVQDWEDERSGVEETLKDIAIARNIQLPRKIVEIRRLAENTLNNIQDEWQSAKDTKNKESIKEIEGRLKDMAKEAGLSRKALLGNRWDDLPPDDQKALALSLLPNMSLKFGGRKEFLDMEYFMQFMEELTGLPFYSLLRRVEAANASAETAKEKVLFRVTDDPTFKDIKTDEEALDRVALELNSRNEAQGVERPEGITADEIIMADAIENIYNAYKPHVRYLRVMRLVPDIEEFKKEFPDAVETGLEEELEWALRLREHGNLDDLWAYLFDKTWGVIESGFDPRLIANPQLRISMRGKGLKVSRGKGRLLRRESVEYPAGKMSKNVLARLGSYIEQLELQWRIEPELDTFDEYWNIAGQKFEDWGAVKAGLETWVERIQNIGLGYNWGDRLIRKIWRQAMVAVFLEPYMSFRNSFQALMFHPDRAELARLLIQHLPSALSEKGKLYFDTYVSQLGGLRRDWLHVGEPGFPGLGKLNRLADNLSLYGYSDFFPRLWSFKASLAKAHRATTQYLEDKDMKTWIKESGANHLRQIERNYVISHFLGQPDKTFDLGVTGLREVSGADMADFYIAQRMADITHFKYRRSTRGLLEMGKTGSTLWNLIVFPRGYAQRLYFQAEKTRRVFSEDATWEEARSGFGDVMKLMVTSLLFGELFFLLTGRKRNPWNPLNILFGWEFGGLFVGVAQDMFNFVGGVVALCSPFASEEEKNMAWGEVTMGVERIPETLIPFYRRAADVVEIVLGETIGKDVKARHLVRQFRSWLDDKYTQEELDDIDRDFWDILKKGLLGGEKIDPTAIQEAMDKVEDSETKLGTQDVMGRYYTLGNHGSAIASATRELPTVFISEQEGWGQLTLFYKDCESQWAELYSLPSKERTDWRKEHPLEEAMLLFWEKYKTSVFLEGSPEAEEVKALLRMWFDLYSVDKFQHGAWTNYLLPAVPRE